MNINVDFLKFELFYAFVDFIITMLNEFKFCIKELYKKDLIWQLILKTFLQNSITNKMKFVFKNNLIYYEQKHNFSYLIIFSSFKKKIFKIIHDHNNHENINCC